MRINFHHLFVFIGLIIVILVAKTLIITERGAGTPEVKAATPFETAIKLNEPLDQWKKFYSSPGGYTLRYPSTWDIRKDGLEGRTRMRFFAPAAISDIPVFSISITEFQKVSGARLRKIVAKEISQAIFPPAREQTLFLGALEVILIPEFLSSGNLYISEAILETENASWLFRSERPLTEPSRPEIFESFIRSFELLSEPLSSGSIVE